MFLLFLIRKDDGAEELLVYLKKTHTGQCHQNITGQMQQHRIRGSGHTEICGAYHKCTRPMWVPTLDLKEDERTEKSEGNDQGE